MKSQKQEFVFLDVGANQGLYSIIAAQNPACIHVYAFEPIKSTASFFSKNLQLNNVDCKVFIIEKAISLISGKQQIHVFPNQSGRASLKPHHNYSNTVDIDVISSKELDEMLKENKARIVLKIDVEGSESEVLRTIFASKLSAQVESIWFEVDEGWTNQETLINFVKERGFSNIKKVGQGLHYDILALRN